MSIPKPITALIVDDEADALATMVDILEAEGVRVLKAADALAGLGAALAGRPDVIILDVKMPRVDGIELATMLRNDGIKAPIILVTAQNVIDFGRWGDMDDVGISRILFKPFARRTFVQCVQDAVSESQRAATTQSAGR